jgi:hypothetical protein
VDVHARVDPCQSERARLDLVIDEMEDVRRCDLENLFREVPVQHAELGDGALTFQSFRAHAGAPRVAASASRPDTAAGGQSLPAE